MDLFPSARNHYSFPRADIYDDYLRLVGAVIRSGINTEGANYLLTSDGQYWCLLGDLDLEVVCAKAGIHARDIGATASLAGSRVLAGHLAL